MMSDRLGLDFKTENLPSHELVDGLELDTVSHHVITNAESRENRQTNDDAPNQEQGGPIGEVAR